MDRAKSSQEPAAPPSTPEDAEDAERWVARINTIYQQRYWAFDVLLPLGTGVVLGAAAGFALLPKKQFRLSTLFAAIFFIAVLMGLPLGPVRLRLQNPRLWYQSQTGDIAFSQSAPNKHDPQSQATSKFLILKHKTIPLILLPGLLIPMTAYFTTRRRAAPK